MTGFPADLMTVDPVTMECSECGVMIGGYEDVGYDGPAGPDGSPDPENTRCNPMLRWVRLCRKCAAEHLEAAGRDE